MCRIKIVLLFLILLMPFVVQKAQTRTLQGTQTNAFTRVGAPEIYKNRNFLGKVSSNSFEVTYEGTVPEEAQTAFNYAIDIWSHLVAFSEPVKITVNFSASLPSETLGSTLMNDFRNNFNNAPFADFQYSIAIAKHYDNTIVNSPDFTITFNSGTPFNYLTDEQPVENTYDFVTVALHEIGHGIGMDGSASINANNVATIGFSGYPVNTSSIYPAIFDKYLISGSTRLTSITDVGALRTSLTGGNVYFDGENAKKANNNSNIKLYAPSTWSSGSSIYHLDETTYPKKDKNSLMTPKIGYAEVIHSPGNIFLGILKDLGVDNSRYIDFTTPVASTQLVKGQVYQISWYDNITSPGDFINLELYKKTSGDPVYVQTINSAPVSTNPGTTNNTFNWTVPSTLENNYYFIKSVGYNTAVNLGQSQTFVISNTPESPRYSPPGGQYANSVTVQIYTNSSVTEIRYTKDGTDPTPSSPLYTSPITVDKSCKIKAKSAITINGTKVWSPVSDADYFIGENSFVAELTSSNNNYKYIGYQSSGTNYGFNEIKAGYNSSRTYRSYVKWSGFRQSIPAGSVIQSVEISMQFIPYPVDASVCFTQFTQGSSDIISYQNIGSAQVYFTSPSDSRIFNISALVPVIQSIVNSSETDEVKVGIKNYNESSNSFFVSSIYAPVIRVHYRGNVEITQQDKDGNKFGEVGVWNATYWDNKLVPITLIRPTSTTLKLKASQGFHETQKYHDWENQPDILNHRQFTVNEGTNDFKARFNNSFSGISIKNSYDGFLATGIEGNDIYFHDPWLSDFYDGLYGYRNRGMENKDNNFKTLASPVDFSQTQLSSYKGVFLNQAVLNGNYYSLKTPLTKTINFGGSLGSQNFNFIGWSANGATLEANGSNPSGYDEKAVVFNTAGAEVQANYKGHMLSGNSSAFSTNSQRKVVRDEAGRLNMVYESMGYVWLTVSSDNGATWSPEIKINYVEDPYITGTATKCPSIVQADDNSYKVYIVYQFNYGDNISGIAVSSYINGVHDRTTLVDNINYIDAQGNNVYIDYSYNTNPVVAVRNNILNVVYRKSSLNGLYITKITDNGTENPEVSTYVTVPGTTTSSSNPAITSGVNTQGYHKFHLVYQEGTATINYFNWLPAASPLGTPLNVSGGSGYTNNTNPSIIQLGDGVRIGWKGYGTGNAAAVFKDPDYYRFWNFDGGNGISSSSVTRTTDGNYVIGWTLQSGLSNRFVINSDFNNIRTFKTTANVNLSGNLQVSNGSAFTDMYAMSLNTQTSPYSFQLSKKVSDIGLGKVSGEDLTYKGRGAVLYKDNAEVYYSLNDITSDGGIIDFVEAEDTLNITESGVLNKYLETKPFNVNSSSELVYGISYGSIDSSALAALLNENSFISFKVEMVDVKTNVVLSTLEDIEYSKINLAISGEKAVRVNLSDIGSKEIKLRVILNDNIDAIYALVDKISTAENISKANIQEVQYTGVTVIKEYDLMQNYPNPFNPNTTITYQMPKDGMVTLKIYDAIGTEVTTLVHEYKSTGKYNVNFNASNLASGVYFYRLQVNDFTLSKKLILMK